MVREVRLPQRYDKILDGLTHLRQETNHALLYKIREDNICEVESIFLTGVGNAGHVSSIPERRDIINMFFALNPDYGYVKSHTHTKSTIKIYGDYYGWKLSDGDREVIKDQINHDGDFMALLVTPFTKILSGFDNPILSVVLDFYDLDKRATIVENKIDAIASNMGYRLDRLKATLTR